jgi:hypothetical protein
VSNKYVVELRGVHEVTLRGRADLDYWHQRLAGEGLFPVASDGYADLLISAVASRFFGFSFCELSVSVFVARDEQATTTDGVFLIQAFNSRRWFAAIERAMYRTPYDPAEIKVSADLPVAMRLGPAMKPWLIAEMGAGHADSVAADDVWEGTIFLPTLRGRREQFFARLAGDTRGYSFRPTDRFQLSRLAAAPVIATLADSGFAPSEWLVRPAATHARSKTVPR